MEAQDGVMTPATDTIFGGYIKTTDRKKWWISFRALSWSDAYSIAEQCNASVDGVVLEEIGSRSGARGKPRSRLGAWEFDGERFVTK